MNRAPLTDGELAVLRANPRALILVGAALSVVGTLALL